MEMNCISRHAVCSVGWWRSSYRSTVLSLEWSAVSIFLFLLLLLLLLPLNTWYLSRIPSKLISLPMHTGWIQKKPVPFTSLKSHLSAYSRGPGFITLQMCPWENIGIVHSPPQHLSWRNIAKHRLTYAFVQTNELTSCHYLQATTHLGECGSVAQENFRGSLCPNSQGRTF